MKKGFTLIELLIVVAIIGIIAAIAIPQLVDYIQRSRCERTEGDIRTISSALETYYVDFQEFPDTGLASMIASLEASVLDTVPPRDGWGRVWIYVTAAADQEYSITSYARDAAAGPTNLKINIAPDDPLRHDYDVMMFNGQFTSQCR